MYDYYRSFLGEEARAASGIEEPKISADALHRENQVRETDWALQCQHMNRELYLLGTDGQQDEKEMARFEIINMDRRLNEFYTFLEEATIAHDLYDDEHPGELPGKLMPLRDPSYYVDYEAAKA